MAAGAASRCSDFAPALDELAVAQLKPLCQAYHSQVNQTIRLSPACKSVPNMWEQGSGRPRLSRLGTLSHWQGTGKTDREQ